MLYNILCIRNTLRFTSINCIHNGEYESKIKKTIVIGETLKTLMLCINNRYPWDNVLSRKLE